MVGANMIDEIDCGSFFDQIDDLLDFPTDDLDTELGDANADFSSFPPMFVDDPLVGSDSVFSDINTASDLSAQLSVPYEDIVQLEWLSNFVEDSFSSGGMSMESNNFSAAKESSPRQSHFRTSSPVSVLDSYSSSSSNGKTIPVVIREKKARSKRPRPQTFNPRPLMNQPVSESEPEMKKQKKIKIVFPSNHVEEKPNTISGNAVRKCVHCEITKTPQWRTGPMGPKTLCNACGVRHKSGRLFPEYRPAASPTFSPSIHSNSHKKVVEMRNIGCAEKD